MKTVEWPIGVNRIITNETTPSIGDNALVSDKSENGTEMSRLTASNSPDTYSVSLWFSHSTQDSFYRNHTDADGNNITEWDAFLTWFKYIAMMGTIPFYFADINDPTGKRKSLYKIKSNGLPKGQVHGDKVKCQMTWVEVFTGAINIPEQNPVSDFIDITNGQIDFRFLEPLTNEDLDIDENSFTATYEYGETYEELSDRGNLVIHGFDFDGYKSALLYFNEFVTEGVYRITVTFTNKAGEQSVTSGLLYVEEEE
jgi:hypothetical protein